MAAQFPLPLACVPRAFAPAWHELTDALPEGTSTFYLAQPPPAAAALLASLQTPAAARAAVAVVDLVRDVVGSGRLAPGALQRLRAAAASGAPWWLVVHNLEGCDSPERVVNGGNLLMMLLERRAGARYEGLELTRSAALLVAGGGGELRALQGRWGALAAAAPPARGQTPLNTDALFARVAKGDFPASSASGSSEWSAALHSAACREARGVGGGGSGSGSAGSSRADSAAGLWTAGAGLIVLALVLAAAWLWVMGRQAAAAGARGARGGGSSSGSSSSSGGGSGSGSGSGSTHRRPAPAPAPAAQPHGPARQRSGSVSAGPGASAAKAH